MDINHLTLLTDLYELTMMQGYFKTGNDETVVFDVFYRDNPSGSGYSDSLAFIPFHDIRPSITVTAKHITITVFL